MNNELYAVKITPMSRFNISNLPNNYFKEVVYLKKFKENNNFIQKLISSFHDYDNLYFISKFYDGNIMDYSDNKWDENQIKFFSACIILCLFELRKEKLIHRDLHFANLVLDEKNYINLIDFHISIEYKNRNKKPSRYSLGALRLCPPELLNGMEYDYNADYYRLGSMIYYVIFGKFPNDIKEEKHLTDIVVSYNESFNYSFDCIDFINKLIISDKEKRIGYKDINELKNHNFFKNFDWNELISGKMKSPFPKIKNDNLGFCKKPFIYKKNIFLTNELSANETFINILNTYDNINNNIVFDILKQIDQLKVNSSEYNK